MNDHVDLLDRMVWRWAWRAHFWWAVAWVLGVACLAYAIFQFRRTGRLLVTASVAASILLSYVWPSD